MLKNSVWIIISLFTLLNSQLAFSQLTDVPPINFEFPADIEPPFFTQATDIIVEASSGLGAKVFYQIPFVSDNVGIISGPTCSPESGAIFALGVSTVTCIASDAEGNVGRATFSVIVNDTTPPSITAPPDIIVENIDVQNIPLGIPAVSDIVDPFPVISNDFTTLLEGENIVTWTATDFSGNSASTKQIVRLVSTNLTDEVLPSDIFVFEATGPDGAKIDPSVLGILDPLQISCQPAIESIFPLGQNQLLCTELDNTNSTHFFTIVVQDTTPPTLFASFVPIKVEEDEGIFAIEIRSTDLVDPNPIVTANINEFPVVNGQLVKLELDSETETKHKTDLIKFEGISFVLSATSSDFSGNTVTVTSLPQFEAEEEELVEEQIEAIEEELEIVEEELEKEIKSIEEEAELTKEQLEEEIEALEEGLEDVDDEKQNEIKSQIEGIKIAIDELEKQTESIVENKKNEIEELKKEREAAIENKKNEIEELKKEREKEELLANIQTQLEAVKSNELTALIASVVATLETKHSSQETFAKLFEQKTIEKSLSNFESDDADSRKKLDQLGLLSSTSSDEIKDLAKEEEKLREAALKELEDLIKNAEKLGDITLKEIENLAKEELRKKEQELKEIEKLANNVSDELEKKRIEKEIEQKKKEVEDFKKQKEAEFEKHKKEQEHYKKELGNALEEQKEVAEKEKKATEKAIEKQKDLEEKVKQAQNEVEEKKKEVEEKAKEAEKKAEEKQKSESGDSSSGSNNDNDSDDDDDGDDDDD